MCLNTPILDEDITTLNREIPNIYKELVESNFVHASDYIEAALRLAFENQLTDLPIKALVEHSWEEVKQAISVKQMIFAFAERLRPRYREHFPQSE